MEALWGLLIIAAIVAFIVYRKRNRNTEVGIPAGSFDIVGEGYYQDALKSVAGPRHEDGYEIPVEIELRREPNNPHDSNAIQCLIKGKPIGHINRDSTHLLHPTLKQAERQGRKTILNGYIVEDWNEVDDEDGDGEVYYEVEIRVD